MTQYAVPDGDDSTGNWGSAPLFQKIDESPSHNDSDSISVTHDGFGSTETCRFTLSNVTDPSSSTDHKVVVRHATSGFYGASLTIKLLQGGTTIKSSSVSSTSSTTTTTLTLSASEANSISDYNALKLELQAVESYPNGETTTVYQANFNCPAASASTPIAAISMNHYRQQRI